MAINYRKVASTQLTLAGTSDAFPVTTVPTLLWSVFASGSNQTLDMNFRNGGVASSDIPYTMSIIASGGGQNSGYQNTEGMYFDQGISVTNTEGVGTVTLVYETMAAPATDA